MTDKRARTCRAARALAAGLCLAGALLTPARLRPARAGRQTRHLLHRRRDVGRNGDRGQPLPLWEGRRTGLAQAPGQGLCRDLGRQRLQCQRPAGRPAAVLALVVHAEPRLRRPQGRTEAPGGARRRASLSPGPGHGFGLGGNGPGHRVQDRFGQHRLAPGRSSGGRPVDDRRGIPRPDRGGDRRHQHGPVRPRDARRVRQPQHQPQLLLYGAQGIQGAGHRRRDHPAHEAGRRHRRRIAAPRQPGLRYEERVHLRIPLPRRSSRPANTSSSSGKPARTAAGLSPRAPRGPPARAASSSGSSAARAAISRCPGSRIPPAGPSSRRGAKKIRRWPKRPRPPSPISPAIPTAFSSSSSRATSIGPPTTTISGP